MGENIESIPQKVIKRIQEKVEEGEKYIFRGENKTSWHNNGDPQNSGHSSPVSSTLYRKLSEFNKKQLDTNDIRIYEQNIVKEARDHLSDKASNIEVLTKLQHYDGLTNLIDFTHNFLIALYFACAESKSICNETDFTESSGRILLVKYEEEIKRDYIKYPDDSVNDPETRNSSETPEGNYYPDNDYVIIESKSKEPRSIFQGSIFIHHRRGLFNKSYFDNNTIPIYCEEKSECLNYLRQYHGIDDKKIFNDIHGFIQNQAVDSNAYFDLSLQELSN